MVYLNISFKDFNVFIQNTASRLITFTKKCDHITSILKQLHWLPVNQRIKFKILYLLLNVLMAERLYIFLILLVTKHLLVNFVLLVPIT